MAEQIKIAFKQRISEKDWLDEDTKERSKKKVRILHEYNYKANRDGY